MEDHGWCQGALSCPFLCQGPHLTVTLRQSIAWGGALFPSPTSDGPELSQIPEESPWVLCVPGFTSEIINEAAKEESAFRSEHCLQSAPAPLPHFCALSSWVNSGLCNLEWL